MELEFYQELFLTAVISILFAFLIGKIAGGGHDYGQRSEDARASLNLPSSGESLRRQADDHRVTADVFGTSEGLRGSVREMDGVQDRVGGIELVEGSSEEKGGVMDKVGEEEEIYEKMAEPEDIERVSADDLKEEDKDSEDKDKEEKDEEVKEAASSSSDVEIVRGELTEIGSGREEDVSTENKGGSLLHGEDEWEGIERSELEERFGVAAEYSVSQSGSVALARLSSDVQMELYGLHKIATEGPCYESQPLPLKVSARARWHAWQKLGRMTPEVAMEQYISLLSRCIPGWGTKKSSEDAKLKGAADITGNEILDAEHPDMGSSLKNQLSPAAQMKSEVHDSDEGDSAAGGLKALQQGLTATFLLNLLFTTRGVFS